MDVYTESSGIDTSPDMNSSNDFTEDFPSPERMAMLKPRTLIYDESDDPPPLQSGKTFSLNTRRQQMKNAANNDDDDHDQIDGLQNNNIIKPIYRDLSAAIQSKMQVESPPYRKVRALRLFDTPATPKTILQKSSLLSSTNTATSKYMKSLTSHPDSFGGFLGARKSIEVPSTPNVMERPKPFPVHNKMLDSITANINPFSPSSSKCILQNKKRSRYEEHQSPSMALYRMSTASHSNESLLNRSTGEDVPLETTQDDDRQAPKRMALQDSNIPRYEKEFVELSLIGVGQFGVAYECLNRLDGCIYAIKKSIKPVAGSVFEKTALNEVYAHAVLGKHDNVVRYYSAWAENRHMLIQNEFCNGGSLQTLLQERCLCEWELRTLLMHIADGLKYIHSNGLVHLDLKAGNIFLTRALARATNGNGNGGGKTSPIDNCHDDGFEDIYDELGMDVTYKIGDLGHVTSIENPQVEEGDCRYLPKEILQEDYTQLPKADIFSLGITLYEAGGGGALPKNGPEWHNLREGRVPDLPNISRELNDLIKLMVHADPSKRPSSTSIFDDPLLCPPESKTKSQLNYELQKERKKNELLMRKLRETKKILKSYQMSKTPRKRQHGSGSPLESDRELRSYSRAKKRPSPESLGSGRCTGFRDRNKNIS